LWYQTHHRTLKYQKSTMGIKVPKITIVHYNTKNPLWDTTISKATMKYYNTKNMEYYNTKNNMAYYDIKKPSQNITI
jgi:hypothetical protein